MRPVIGLDCCLQVHPGDPRERIELWRDYTDAVERAGGTPVLLPPTENPAHVDEQLDLVDGVVFTGGPDLDPKLYGARRHPKTTPMRPARQLHDVELARAVIRRKVPFFAVCGGLQLVNVVCGGDLVQHLPDVVGAGVAHRREDGGYAAHDVEVEPGTRLAAIVGPGTLAVNSNHHQAIGRLGSGLRVSARSADGVIEAIESKGEAFGLCVQWHPERLAADPRHFPLFEALIEAARDESDVA